MAINKKLIHFKTKSNFNTEVANGNILDTSIVFIKDSQEIYTHGRYYTCKDWANDINNLQTQINTLVSGNASTAIENFNEIISFLEGIEDSESLDSIIASIEQQIAGKQDVISDLATIRSGAAKGATALQSYTEKYTGTITGIKMNGASKGTSGVVDLGTVITSHQDISGKQDVAIKFENKSASTWVSDSTYEDFPYRCDINCSGVTSSMYAEVVFGVDEAISGDYAPMCETKSNIVSIWSAKNETITVPTILITK